MTKTIHPLMSHYSYTKLGGGGAYSKGGAYFKFWPIGGALIREGALIRRFTVVHLSINPEAKRIVLGRTSKPLVIINN